MSTQVNQKKLRPLWVVTSVWLVAAIALIFNGLVNHDFRVGLWDSFLAETVGQIIIWPILHIAIASIWKSKRNSKSRRNIFFGWSICWAVVALTLVFAKLSGVIP